MSEFCALRAKTYSFLIDDYSDDDYEKNKTINKRAKGTKKCIVKREIWFKNYADALFNDEVIIKSEQRFRSDHHKVYTEEVYKIALSSYDDKRIQTYDKITTYPCGTNAFMVCENEMLLKKIIKKTLSIKMEKIIHEHSQLNIKSQEIINESVISKNELQSLKNESQEVISELAVSRNKLDSLKNQSRVLRDKSQVLVEELQLHGDESLIARNKIHVVKKETRVLRNKSLLVKEELHKIRKEAQLLKNKLLFSKNKLHDAKKETEAFRDESEKRKKARINQIINNLEKHNKKTDQLNAKSKKLLEKSDGKLQKLRDETKKYRDEAKK